MGDAADDCFDAAMRELDFIEFEDDPSCSFPPFVRRWDFPLRPIYPVAPPPMMMAQALSRLKQQQAAIIHPKRRPRCPAENRSSKQETEDESGSQGHGRTAR